VGVKSKRQRAFARDAYFGFRLPSDDKSRIFELGRRKRRDPSSLVIEWVTDGMRKAERELLAQPQ
jgi:hypothetical protein